MNTSKLKFLGAMSIFGTVGIFVRAIPLSSAGIACFRGFVGCLFLLLFMTVTRKKLSGGDIRQNLPVLLLSGAAIGTNWILLFEAYRYTTVATATVCYYLAPVFLLIASPLLGEKLTAKKLLCVGVALTGMVCVSGVLKGSLPVLSELTGIGLGVGAAVLYATVMLLNKKLKSISAYDKTVIQLGTSATVVLPYLLLTGVGNLSDMTGQAWLLLAVVGIVHTGIAYTMYFGALQKLSAQTVALFCYLDPVIAILLSALLLQEPMDPFSILGTVLILGSALYSELPDRKSPSFSGSKSREKIRKKA